MLGLDWHVAGELMSSQIWGSLGARLAVAFLVMTMSLVTCSRMVFAQTAHQYFQELANKNALNRYSDEYVCFPDKDVGNFAILARATDVAREMASTHEKPIPAGHYIFVETYDKGVSNGMAIFRRAKGNPKDSYSAEFDHPFHGKGQYLINWITGRYRFLVYELDRDKFIPASENDGKCQLIHPWAPPGAASKPTGRL